jgi:hypothetical protein
LINDCTRQEAGRSFQSLDDSLNCYRRNYHSLALVISSMAHLKKETRSAANLVNVETLDKGMTALVPKDDIAFGVIPAGSRMHRNGRRQWHLHVRTMALS